MNMTLAQLVYVVKIADTKSMNKAILGGKTVVGKNSVVAGNTFYI